MQYLRNTEPILTTFKNTGYVSVRHRPFRVARTLPAGAEIYAEGEDAGNIHEILIGAVRVYRLYADGRRQIVAFYLAGEIFGLEAGSSRSFFAETITDAKVVTSKVAASGSGDRKLAALALQGMQRAQEHLLVLGRPTARERVAAFLLDLAKRQGSDESLELPMPRVDIADYLGLSLETVSRTIARLRAQGIIEVSRNKYLMFKKREILCDLCK